MPDPKPKRLALHNRIFLGLVGGVVAGIGCNLAFGPANPSLLWFVTSITEPLGQLFLRLLLMTVVPLVFSSIVVGVIAIGDVRKLGRVGLKAFIYCLAISTISVGIGLFLSNTIRPGKRIDPAISAGLQQRYAADATNKVAEARKVTAHDPVLLQVVKTIVPTNPFASIASPNPDMIHLMFFALAIAIAITLLPPDRTIGFVQALEGLQAVSTKLIDLVMWFAPLAVACLLFTNTARFGLDLLLALGWFIVTVLLGLVLHLFGVYSLSVYFLSRLSPWDFFRRIRTVMVTAFSTSSSNATLPTTMRVSEENLGVPKDINSFVLTVGATANQNGTALYEGATVLFLAQLAGVDLTLGQQITVAYLAILGSIGTAGIPSASIPFIVLVLATINVNPALIAIILGVDRILDMCRTVVNVVGDMTAATYVARSEGYALLADPAGQKRTDFPIEPSQ